MALVEPPRPPDRDPLAVHDPQREVGRADRPLLQRRVQHAGRESLGKHELARDHRLLLAELGEVDVDPAGEPVGEVPLALAVAKEDQRRHQSERKRATCRAAHPRATPIAAPPATSSGRCAPTYTRAKSVVDRGTADRERRRTRQHRGRAERDDGRHARVARREPEPALRCAPDHDAVEVRVGPAAARRPLHQLRPAPRGRHRDHGRDADAPITAREQRARREPAAQAAELHDGVHGQVSGVGSMVDHAHHAFLGVADLGLACGPPRGAERDAAADDAEQVAGALRHG